MKSWGKFVKNSIAKCHLFEFLAQISYSVRVCSFSNVAFPAFLCRRLNTYSSFLQVLQVHSYARKLFLEAHRFFLLVFQQNLLSIIRLFYLPLYTYANCSFLCVELSGLLCCIQRPYNFDGNQIVSHLLCCKM